MKTEFKTGLTADELNTLVERIGGREIALKVISGEMIVSEPTKWREEKGVIYFSVTSDGTTGPGWIKRLEDKGFKLGDSAKSVLRSIDFKPTTDIITEVAVLKGILFEDDDRITKKIHTEAAKRKLETPNAEIACLIREQFTDEEIEAMGLKWIVSMHEPIKDSAGDPHLLIAGCGDVGHWLSTDCGAPDDIWHREGCFVFAVSQQKKVYRSDALNA